MNKKYIWISGIFLAIALAAFFAYRYNVWAPTKPDNSIILFWSENCPHCLSVEAFLNENKVASKVSFENKSLDNNPANVNELKKRALTCNLIDNIGIPFLWDGLDSKCLVGQDDVINFFKDKVK